MKNTDQTEAFENPEILLSTEQEDYLQDIIEHITKHLSLDEYPEYVEGISSLYRQAIASEAQMELSTNEEKPKITLIELFGKRHKEHYKPKAKFFSQEIEYGFQEDQEPYSLIIESGMYGGKTTLAILIKDELELNPNNCVITCISTAMAEDFLTARSISSKPIPAERFGPNKYEALKDKIRENQAEGKNVTLLLDEFSFLFGKDLDMLEDFHQYCKANNVAVIFLGLNKGYTGLPLEIFTRENSNILQSEKYECKAFIPEKDNHKNSPPSGKYTTRYVRIGNRLLLDLGILQLVVSKEEKNKNNKSIVVYTATTKENTMLGIFKDKTTRILNSLSQYEEIFEKNQYILKNRH